MLKVASGVAASIGCAIVVIAACSSSGDVPAPTLQQVFDSASRERGEALMAHLQCTVCHAASERVVERLQPEAAPNLARIGARKTPAALRELLLEPRKAKPGSAMPDMLAGLSAREREATVDDLVQFLATLGGPFDTSGTEVDVTEIERGRQLLHSVGCVACHAPQESVDDLATPIWDFKLDAALAPNVIAELGASAFATNVNELAKFLVDPLSVRPAGRMPSCKLADGEARAIAAYLLRGQAGAIAEMPGWRCEYFEASFTSVEQDMHGVAPISGSVIDDVSKLPELHRDEQFAFRISGLLAAPATGRYEFSTKSDDGSRIYIDDKLVVNNDGDHAPAEKSAEVWLERGQHAIVVTMYENAGGEELSVSWRPPSASKESIPASAMTHWGMKLAPPSSKFVADAKKVERGRMAFGRFQCLMCHPVDASPTLPSGADDFAELATHADGGCLASQADDKAPRFDLDDAQRASLRSIVANASAVEARRAPHEALDAMLTRFDCLACHSRNGTGGPSIERVGYFKQAVEVDLGNEGRLPPKLDRIGAKLYGEAVAKVLIDGDIERPYIATRMPLFGAENVKEIVELFEQVDGSQSDLVAPPFSTASAEIGRKLAGTGALGCIQCHMFDGVQSLGIPAADLAHVKERIKPAWFKQLLLDPKSLGMNTRMPVFWDSSGVSAAKTILGGDPKQQVDALWSYLSLGKSMPLPDGLVVPDSEYELTPTTEPILCGVFMKDASPRCILVGTPELVHYAFDVENSRLVCAWRGRFFNAKGTWNGRAGSLEWPQSDDVLEFPKLPPVAILSKPDDPWPTALGREAGYRRLGYHFNDRKPIFRYALEDVTVVDRTVSVSRENPVAPDASLYRQLILECPLERKDVFVLIAKGDRIERVDDRWWTVDGRMRFACGQAGSERSADAAVMTQTADGTEARVPVHFGRSGSTWMASIEVLVSW